MIQGNKTYHCRIQYSESSRPRTLSRSRITIWTQTIGSVSQCTSVLFLSLQCFISPSFLICFTVSPILNPNLSSSHFILDRYFNTKVSTRATKSCRNSSEHRVTDGRVLISDFGLIRPFSRIPARRHYLCEGWRRSAL